MFVSTANNAEQDHRYHTNNKVFILRRCVRLLQAPTETRTAPFNQCSLRAVIGPTGAGLEHRPLTAHTVGNAQNTLQPRKRRV
jgi:hypothetical protein